MLTVGIEGRKGWLAAVHCADQKELMLKQHHSKGLDDFLRAIGTLLGCNDNTRPSDQLTSDGDDGMPTITLQ